MNEPNARDNIALQYVPDTDDLSPSAAQPPADAPWAYGLTQPPVVKWLGKRLEVVTPGIVQTMVIQKGAIEGIGVSYEFMAGPPRSWNGDLAGDKDNH